METRSGKRSHSGEPTITRRAEKHAKESNQAIIMLRLDASHSQSAVLQDVWDGLGIPKSAEGRRIEVPHPEGKRILRFAEGEDKVYAVSCSGRGIQMAADLSALVGLSIETGQVTLGNNAGSRALLKWLAGHPESIMGVRPEYQVCVKEKRYCELFVVARNAPGEDWLPGRMSTRLDGRTAGGQPYFLINNKNSDTALTVRMDTVDVYRLCAELHLESPSSTWPQTVSDMSREQFATFMPPVQILGKTVKYSVDYIGQRGFITPLLARDAAHAMGSESRPACYTTYTRRTAQGSDISLSVGMGFRTAKNAWGQVLRLDCGGNIERYRELWSHAHMPAGALQGTRGHEVYASSVVHNLQGGSAAASAFTASVVAT